MRSHVPSTPGITERIPTKSGAKTRLAIELFYNPLRRHMPPNLRKDEVHCKYCAVAVRHWSRVKPAPLSASLQVTLQLEAAADRLLAWLATGFVLGWSGGIHRLAADPLALLTQRDYQDVNASVTFYEIRRLASLCPSRHNSQWAGNYFSQENLAMYT